jgi:hypothetical protein
MLTLALEHSVLQWRGTVVQRCCREPSGWRQFSEEEGDSGDDGSFKCRFGESGLLQAEIFARTVICDEVCEDIACENGGIQASMVLIETVAKGQSLLIADALTIVEAVAYHSPRSLSPRPDKWATMRSVGGCISSCLAWSRDVLTEVEAISLPGMVSGI